MSVSIVRPNETVDLGGASVTGAGGDADVALSDDDNATYISLAGALTHLGFAEPTIPGGAVLRNVIVRTTTAQFSGSPETLIAIPVPGGEGKSQTVTWLSIISTAVGSFTPDEFDVGDVELQLLRFSEGTLNVFEVAIVFHYVTQPVVTVTQPTGTLTEDNQPAVWWDGGLDADGGAQTRFEVKVFDAATFGDFSTVDPDTSEPFTESGEVASTAIRYEVEEVLPNDTYRAYARIAQTVNGELHWSEWDSQDFTMDADAPGIPTISLVPQPACGRMRIDLDPRDQLCTNPEAETDTAGWTNHASDPFERVTSLPTLNGLPAGLTTGFHCVTNADSEGASDSVAVESGKTYRFSVYVYLDTNTATGIAVQIKNAATVTKATGATFSTLDSWTRIDVSVTADATETWTFRVRQVGAGATDFYFTAVLIEESAALGEYFEETTDAFQVQRSDDAGATWADLRTVDGGGRRNRSSNPLTSLLDWEAPNGATATYRARAIHSFAEGDTFSGWVSDSDSWESTDAWLKHPYDPTLNAIVSVYSQPGYDRSPRQSEVQPLGRSDVIVVSDRRQPERGEIVLETDTAAEQAALDALLDSLAPLLLQMPPAHHWPDRWVRFGDQSRTRMVDKLEVEDALDTLRWVKVARPSGNLLAWPSVTCP